MKKWNLEEHNHMRQRIQTVRVKRWTGDKPVLLLDNDMRKSFGMSIAASSK